MKLIHEEDWKQIKQYLKILQAELQDDIDLYGYDNSTNEAITKIDELLEKLS